MEQTALPTLAPVFMVVTTWLRTILYVIGIGLTARTMSLHKNTKTATVLIVSILLIAWTFLIINLGRSNVFKIDESTSFPPPIILTVVLPVLIAYLLLRYWKPWQNMVFQIPQHWLIGVQAIRITGAMIFVLYLRGLLPKEFSIPVGSLDVFVGLTALPVAYFYYKQKPFARRLAYAWNIIGITDFVFAVPLGIMTSPGPAHLLALDSPNLFMSAYPIVLFPTFSVATGLILHIYSIALLNREKDNGEAKTAQSLAWQVIALFAIVSGFYVAILYFLVPAISNRPLGFQIHVELQKTFAAHPIGLYFHIVPSVVAIIIGPFQFLRELREKRLNLHRWLGRLYLFGIFWGGLGGLYMAQYSFAGFAARSGFSILAILWLGSGYMAYRNIRQGNVEAHQAWMIRNYALTFAAVTLRIYTRSFISMGLLAPDFHAFNAWACWVPNLLFAQWLIYRNRQKQTQNKQSLPSPELQP